MNEKIDIIKKCFYEMQGDYWRDEGIAAAERVAEEIERLEEEKILLIKFINEIASHGQRRESEVGK